MESLRLDTEHMNSKTTREPNKKDHEPVMEAPTAGVSPTLLPAGVEAVMKLFATHLGGVSFPDVSASSLQEAANQIAELNRAVEAARSALSRAESARAEAERTLLQLADKGLAYARVFSAGDPELSNQLAALSLQPSRAASRGVRKPRKRKPDPAPEVTASAHGG